MSAVDWVCKLETVVWQAEIDYDIWDGHHDNIFSFEYANKAEELALEFRFETQPDWKKYTGKISRRPSPRSRYLVPEAGESMPLHTLS